MLELNKEYTYREICSVLGWKESTGNQKIKQIKEIESSYEFFHPENKQEEKRLSDFFFETIKKALSTLNAFFREIRFYY